MSIISRRMFLGNAAGLGAAIVLAGCQTEGGVASGPSAGPAVASIAPLGDNPDYALMYAPVTTEPFPVNAIDLTKIDNTYLRKEVDYRTSEEPGTIVVDPYSRFLYYIQPGGRAIRYGVGVGKEGFAWSGTATINSKQEWPDWYPPAEMIERRPDIKPQLAQLQSGLGVPGGARNPIGARGMYLWQNGKDTLYRIHGTIEPYSIGKSVSSGCIRMINQDAMDLYSRVAVGTEVKVLGSAGVA